ncbi:MULTISPECIES: DUF7147 family protein [Staphylococcus]|uniref:DUF7147 domain-containing protein n=1 Tax=Staphylococcus lugdunensis TaxID=28035 RepID=A0ABD4EHS8_STALU|nr:MULTISPECIES: hypothetical protein [Staphylococcus]ARJ14287.1 hypothetical protein B7468_08160 [Staphylococcus lugdunensis]EFU85213.1 hypothetical protein HMPREF0790_0645 [Staphylococcus lugdunensis M23590]KXA39745.1 hypothetical protein HMPREF3225_00522 [Staphylococcus lugdunensis]MCH8666176.1 hypothetical protein [Staphylococcus lugdunensis]OFJ64805.1 hypothetical protein HMPREF2855_05960 [Staphylococcus sp. HMSC077E11]
MKQSFIVLGEGLTDLFEFLTLIDYDHARVDKIMYFHTPESEKQQSSVALVMQPTEGHHFQAMYIMLNAMSYPYPESNKKFQMINEKAEQYNIQTIGVDVQPIEAFHDLDLYFKYLISILRLQNWIPPLQ